MNQTSAVGVLMVGNSSSLVQEREERLTSFLESEAVQIKVTPSKRLLRFRSVSETYFPQRDVNFILLAHQGPKLGSEFHSSIYNEDYSYFSGIFDEYRQAELTELTNQFHREFYVLSFCVSDQEEVLMTGHFCRERESQKKKFRDLVLKRDKFLEDVRDVTNSFLVIEIALEPLGYLGSLHEKVQ